jgi:hypothetical protein
MKHEVPRLHGKFDQVTRLHWLDGVLSCSVTREDVQCDPWVSVSVDITRPSVATHGISASLGMPLRSSQIMDPASHSTTSLQCETIHNSHPERQA